MKKGCPQMCDFLGYGCIKDAQPHTPLAKSLMLVVQEEVFWEGQLATVGMNQLIQSQVDGTCGQSSDISYIP